MLDTFEKQGTGASRGAPQRQALDALDVLNLAPLQKWPVLLRFLRSVLRCRYQKQIIVIDTCQEFILALGSASLRRHSRPPHMEMLFHARGSDKMRSRWNLLGLYGFDLVRI